MSFTPFDVLSAAELNELVENIEALAAGTGLDDGAVTPLQRSGGFAIGTFTNSGTADNVISSLGFAPKMVFIFSMHATNNTTAFAGIGAATAISNLGMMARAISGNFSSHANGSNAVISTTTDGNIAISGAITLNSDGFTVDYSVGANNRQFGYIAFG